MFFLHPEVRMLQSARMEPLTAEEIRRAVRLALEEDVGSGDATTLSTVPEKTLARAALTAREPLTLAGLVFAEAAFRELSPAIQFERNHQDGDRIEANAKALVLSGSARAILTAERVALNFVQRLSGIASLTARFVEAVHGTRAKILDTRKTTPGWRRFEKYAVTCGGGENHRIGLFDQVLIKDNHLAALREEKPNAIATAVRRARAQYPQLKVDVEADTLEQLEQILATGADTILLANMSPAPLRSAIEPVVTRAQTQAS